MPLLTGQCFSPTWVQRLSRSRTARSAAIRADMSGPTSSGTTTASTFRPGGRTRRVSRSTSSRTRTRPFGGDSCRRPMRSSTTCVAINRKSWGSTMRASRSSTRVSYVSTFRLMAETTHRKSWPGYDYLMQAEAGLMSLTGEPEHPPTRFGASMIDFMTGITGMVGLLSCLMRAKSTGQGLRRGRLAVRRRTASAFLSRQLVPQWRRHAEPHAAQRTSVTRAGPDRSRPKTAGST